MSCDDFLSVGELAAWLGVPVRTIHAWRYAGTAPPAYKVGRHLRFRRAEIEAWLAHRRDPQPLRAVRRAGRS